MPPEKWVDGGIDHLDQRARVSAKHMKLRDTTQAYHGTLSQHDTKPRQTREDERESRGERSLGLT